MPDIARRIDQAAFFLDVIRVACSDQAFLADLATTVPTDVPIVQFLDQLPIGELHRLYVEWVEHPQPRFRLTDEGLKRLGHMSYRGQAVAVLYRLGESFTEATALAELARFTTGLDNQDTGRGWWTFLLQGDDTSGPWVEEMEHARPPEGLSGDADSASGETDSSRSGTVNKHGQMLMGAPAAAGNDPSPRAVKMFCTHCYLSYGANGSDVWLRKCPRCQGGVPGIAC